MITIKECPNCGAYVQFESFATVYCSQCNLTFIPPEDEDEKINNVAQLIEWWNENSETADFI